MALHWTFRSLPELNHLTERERHHVLRTCAGPSVYWQLFRLALCGAAVAAGVTAIAFAGAPGTTMTILICAAAALGFALVYQFCMRIVRADLRLTLVKGFSGERLPVCLGCGYDLKGVAGETCPECGKGIIVRGGGKAR